MKGIRSNIKRAVLLPKKEFFFADFTFAKLFSQFGSFADLFNIDEVGTNRTFTYFS